MRGLLYDMILMTLASLPQAGFCMILMDRTIDGQYLSQAEHRHGIDFKVCIEMKLLTLTVAVPML